MFLALVPLVPVAHASTGPCEGDFSLGIVQITGGTADSTYYMDDRNFVTGHGIWLYAETNGIWSGHEAGVYLGDPDHVDLQRGWNRLFGGVTPDDDWICVDDPYAFSDLNIF